MSEEKFDQWAIIEIMGHQRIAGRVTEASIGGSSFLRVDVPEVDGRPGFTKYFGQSAIYAMTPVDEEIARRAAASFRPEPVDPYTVGDIRRQIDNRTQRPAAVDPDFDEPEFC